MKTYLSKFIFCFATFLFLTSSVVVFSDKFIPATLLYKDGTELDGLVHSAIKNDQVKFKLSDKSKISKLDPKAIDQIVFHTAEDPIIIKHMELKTAKLSGEYKKAKKPAWLHVIETCDEIGIYESFGGLDVSRTKLFLIHVDPLLNRIYAKRKGENQATLIATALSSYYPAFKSKITVKKFNKKMLSKYFKNNSKALSIIDSDKASLNLIFKIFDSICQTEK